MKKQMSLKLLRRSSTVIAHEETARNSLERNKARAGLIARVDDAQEKKQINLIEPEVKMTGGVRFRDYVNFMSFGAGWFGIIFFFVINFTTAFSTLIPSYILSKWTT